jgi:hypothetical protein
LRIESALVRRLRFAALPDLRLSGCDFVLQVCAARDVVFFLRHEGRDGGVHFGGFGVFFLERFGVRGGLRFEV